MKFRARFGDFGRFLRAASTVPIPTVASIGMRGMRSMGSIGSIGSITVYSMLPFSNASQSPSASNQESPLFPSQGPFSPIPLFDVSAMSEQPMEIPPHLSPVHAALPGMPKTAPPLVSPHAPPLALPVLVSPHHSSPSLPELPRKKQRPRSLSSPQNPSPQIPSRSSSSNNPPRREPFRKEHIDRVLGHEVTRGRTGQELVQLCIVTNDNTRQISGIHETSTWAFLFGDESLANRIHPRSRNIAALTAYFRSFNPMLTTAKLFNDYVLKSKGTPDTAKQLDFTHGSQRDTPTPHRGYMHIRVQGNVTAVSMKPIAASSEHTTMLSICTKETGIEWSSRFEWQRQRTGTSDMAS